MQYTGMINLTSEQNRMRYAEIISEEWYNTLQEKISVTSVGRQLRSELLNGLPDLIFSKFKSNIKQLPFNIYTIDHDAPSPNDEPGIIMVTSWLKAWFESKMTIEMRKIDDRFSSGVTHFSYMEKSDGQWRNRDIHITDRYLNIMGNTVYNKMNDSFMSSGFEVCKLDTYSLAITDTVDEIVSVFVHELTHSEQTKRSKVSNNYRSYLATNKDKFYKILDSINDELERNKAYLASPEEIGAFAQAAAYDMIKDLLDFPPEDQISGITDTMHRLSSQWGRYNIFFQSSDKIENKVSKRFLKRLYQELDDTRDNIMNKHLALIKKTKEEDDYNEWMMSLDIDDPNYDDNFMMGPPKKK